MTYAQLLAQYKKKHGRLVEPRQGFDSLYPELWLAYSMLAKRGFYDVGTYVNKPLDHSYGDRHGKPRMALAFDMRRKGWVNWIGWGKRNAWKNANLLWQHHVALNIDYIIVGDRIISRAKPYWHYYGPDKSHYWHIHVSGWVPGK
jgi:hypothetical protein